MSLRLRLVLALCPVFALAPSLLTVSSAESAAHAADPAAPAAQLSTFDGEGATYFALSIAPGKVSAPAAPQDIVVLFDTSASQTGQYLADSTAALKSLLASVNKNDRVNLLAIDLKAVPMSTGFIAPVGPEMDAALAKLAARAPLGSTNMGVGLTTAINLLADSKKVRSIVYLGDGVNRAGFLGNHEFSALVQKLADSRISVTSFAIGNARDIQLLATLANQTGGSLVIDDDNLSGQQGGADLAKLLSATVLWPTATSGFEATDKYYPTRVPPLRSDRDTIVIGKLKNRDELKIKMTAEAAGKSFDLAWNVKPEASNPDQSYLPKLLEVAAIDNGVTLPTVGSTGLQETRRMVLAGAHQLSDVGGRALASGDLDGAAKAAKAALDRDPTNLHAQAVIEAVRKAKAGKTAEGDIRLGTGEKKPVTKSGLVGEFEQGEGVILDQLQGSKGQSGTRTRDVVGDEAERAKVAEQVLISEVEDSIKSATDQAGNDPEGAIRNLKSQHETLLRVTGVRAEIRTQLMERVRVALTNLEVRLKQYNEDRRLADERTAIRDERLRIADKLRSKEERTRQLMARFNSLMSEGRYRDAEDSSAMAIRVENPDMPLGMAAVTDSRLIGSYQEFMEIRDRRMQNYLRTLVLVEESTIPMPDDPPIIYPDPAFWQNMTERRKKYGSVDLSKTGSAEERIFKALEAKTKLEFVETPLQEVVDYLKEAHKIEIQFNTLAMMEAGVALDTPITKNLKDISLRSALRLLLQPSNLTYVVKNEVLMITTTEDASKNLVSKVYPVADLVLPISSGVGANPFSLGGGLGGQGGFGGGLGAGGQQNNAGGFGGGGFGGGQQGGGIFAVADQPAGKTAVVSDDADLRLGPSTTDKAAPAPVTKPEVKPAVPATTAPAVAGPIAAPRRIVVQPKAGQSVQDAWKEHFKSKVENQAAVRQTVRELMLAGKYEETAAVIYAALQNTQPQPWMYEALALALQAQDAPKDELERALMSAVDFSTSPDEIMVVATYMARIGLDERALELFQGLSKNNPQRHEPYTFGLKSAQRLNDVEGIKWACLGILRQAWSKDEEEIGRNAYRVAMAQLATLREQKSDEADAFERDIRLAMSRDIVVKMSYNGDADIDILTEEPSGTICSLRTPRTTAGGVFSGDAYTLAKDKEKGLAVETYVCPEGFSGKYRVMLRRIWGMPTAGKVTIDIYTHYGTKYQTHIREHIPLAEKDAILLFDLKNGRRAEALADHQIANIAKAQQNVSKAVLAQQLDLMTQTEAVRDYEIARRQGFVDGRLLGAGRNRGVGYRPVITTLPEGTNMTATAVISADRRYVRITAVPLFSVVGDVSTFNFATGSSSNNGNGNGNVPPVPGVP